ncbi:MAG: hypothetical protein GQF41_0698 [Candidatus Rifleibacterium amylolyticum]|nr:MAG: hypothetical protein GQF41_0698 [Candidatus Rifleibacterium amylolyticum]
MDSATSLCYAQNDQIRCNRHVRSRSIQLWLFTEKDENTTGDCKEFRSGVNCI